MKVGPKEVLTSRRRAPDGTYVVALGPLARELLGVDAEKAGVVYIWRARGWGEVKRLLERARALGLDVKA